MSEAAFGYGRRKAVFPASRTAKPQASGLASFLRERRSWRNAAIAVVSVVALANIALLVLTAGF